MKLHKFWSAITSHKRYTFFTILALLIVGIFVISNFVHMAKASFGSWGDTSLINACEDSRGRVILVSPGTDCNPNETEVTWLKDVNVGSGLNINRSSSGATLSLENSGWAASSDTWTYASSTTFTIAGDKTVIYSKGTRLKWTQTTVRYGVVVDSSYSSGPNTTTVTILSNSDYTVANSSISDNYYSYQGNPQGYPGWFACSTISTWVNIDNGSGGSPSLTSCRQKVDGNTLSGKVLVGSSYTSKATPTADFGFLNSVNAVNTSNNTAIGSGWVVTTSDGMPHPAVAFYINSGYVYIDMGTLLNDNTQLDWASWSYSYEF